VADTTSDTASEVGMFSVTLAKIISEFQLEIVFSPPNLDSINIESADVNRSGLQLTGFLGHFDNHRIQIMGTVEVSYLSTLNADERRSRLDAFFARRFPCLVVTRGLDIFPELLEVAAKHEIPLLRTSDETSRFLSGVIRYLNIQLAPRIIMHGVLIDVYGEGILILGESGIGKSEAAMELVNRGHRLIADDVVEVRKVSDKTLLANSPDIIRHFIEIRGIGILDVKNLYGVGAVKMQDNINLVINLEPWDKTKEYERLGLIEHTMEILDIKVPLLNIPVRPGRNLAIIVEVAAMNNRQKKMGYNAAQALSERISWEFDRGEADD